MKSICIFAKTLLLCVTLAVMTTGCTTGSVGGAGGVGTGGAGGKFCSQKPCTEKSHKPVDAACKSEEFKNI